MTKNFKRLLAILLSFVLITCSLPLQSFAASKTKDTSELKVSTADTKEEDLKVIGEVEEKRDEFTKVFALEDGSLYEVKSSTPLHIKKNNEWTNAKRVSLPDTVGNVKNTINKLTEAAKKKTEPTRADYNDTHYNGNDFDFCFLNSNGNDPNQITFSSDSLFLLKDLEAVSVNPSQLTYSYVVSLNLNLDFSDVPQNQSVYYPTVTAFACQSDWTGYYENPVPVDDFDDFDYSTDDSVDILGAQTVKAQGIYYFDATTLYNRWESGAQDNYGFCFMTDWDTNVGVEVQDLCFTRRYKNISALNTETSYHSLDMGLAGTALVEDYSGETTIFRNEMGLSNNAMPVEITRLISSNTTADNYHYGDDSIINYHSMITVAGQVYTWSSLKGENVTFVVTNTSQNVADQEGLGYSLNVSNKKITASDGTVYTFTLYSGSYYLSTVVDAYSNAVNIAYTTQNSRRRINYIEEVANHRRYVFGYTNVSFSFNGSGFSRNVLTSITAREKYNNSYRDIQIGGAAAKVQYQYVPIGANKIVLYRATYPDNSYVMYNHDADGNVTDAVDVDGRNISFDFSGTVPIYSINPLNNYSEYEIVESTANRDYKTFVSYNEKVPNVDDNSSQYLDKSSLALANENAFSRRFTDQNNKVVETAFDREFRPKYVLDSNGDRYLFTYGATDSITKIKKHGSAGNLIYNGNFEEDIDGWDLEGVNDGDVLAHKIKDRSGKESNYILFYTNTTDDITAYQIADVSEIASGTKMILDADAILNSGASIGNHFSGVEVYACDFSGEVESNAEPLIALGFGDCYKYEKQHKCGFFTLPSNVEYLKVQIHYTPQYREGYFDNISLIADVNGKIVETMSSLPSDTTVHPTETYNYDSHGLPLEHVKSYGSDVMVEKFTYDSAAPYNTASHTDWNNSLTTYSYGASTGLLNSKTHTGATTSYTYNPMGLLASVSTVYNNVNNNPVTMTNSFTYSHNKIASVQHGSVIYSYDYDSFGRVKGVSQSTDSGQTSSDLISTSYANGNVDTISYANGDQIKYTYDSDTNKVTAIAFKDSTDSDFTNLATYQYDLGSGESVRINDVHSDRQISIFEDGTYTVTDHNNDSYFPDLPILNAVENPDGSEAVNVFDLKYTYDHSESNLTGGIRHTESTVRYAVDEVPVSFTVTENNETFSIAYGGTQSDDYTTFITEKDTDVFGRVVSTSAHYETADEDEREITNTYGYKGFVTDIDSIPNQSATSNLISSYHTQTQVNSDDVSNYTFLYNYENNSDLVKNIAMVDNSEHNNPITQTLYRYKYDAVGQIIAEYNLNEDRITEYSYDSNGNITQKKQFDISSAIMDDANAFSYHMADSYSYEKIAYTYSTVNPNQLVGYQHLNGTHNTSGDTETGYTPVSVTYDSNGNALTTSTTYGANSEFSLTWDGVSLASAENTSKRIEYVYDTDNQLVRRLVYKKYTSGGSRLDSVEEFVWKDGRMDAMEYYAAENEALRISAKYLYDEEGKLVGMIPHVKNFFAEIPTSDPQPDLSEIPMESDVPLWLINDAQGNVIAMYSEDKGISYNCSFDAEGNVTIDLQGSYVSQIIGNSSNGWQAFGSLLSIAMFYAGMNNFTYRGYYQDKDTGLIFTDNRVYNPYLSRFINSEPQGVLDNADNCLSFNEYAFARNNPVNMDAFNQSIFDKTSVPYGEFKSVLWMKSYFG